MKLTKFRDLPGDSPISKLTNWAGGRTIYTQVKHHGIYAEWRPSGGLFTRQNKQWDLLRLPPAFHATLLESKLFLRGELTVPDANFQTLCGILSVNSLDPIPAVTFNVFDCCDIRKPASEQPLSLRLLTLNSIDRPHIRVIPTHLHTPESADRFFNETIACNHEGVVYRIDPAYENYPEQLPHPHMVKRKAIFSDEGTCIGIEMGEGKRKNMLGAMILRLDNNKHVKIGGGSGMTDGLLTRLYNTPPLNARVTFTYEELSADGIPLRPQFVAIRSYE